MSRERNLEHRSCTSSGVRSGDEDDPVDDRECGRGIYLHAGPEVSVVSTKTLTCTATAFAMLAIGPALGILSIRRLQAQRA